MPELAEIARIVNRLSYHLVGKTITKVTALEDLIVYKDTTHTALQTALEGRKVLAAKRWGKYFWLVMDSPTHPLMHFGMSGWIYIKSDPSAHYRSSEKPTSYAEWPPKYLKFNLHLNDSNEIAFTDPRRLGRIRLISHADGNALRDLTPLKENGPDPVLSVIELDWLADKLRKRKVPVKAWLLDQSMLAGVGNWVGDEILWNARIHPEQHSNTLTDAQVAELHRALLYVTKFAVDVEADSSKFPENWLMLHRWGKGKKGNVLPSGEKIEFVKVGSRTSAFVPSLQRLPGAEEVEEEKPKSKGRKATKKVEDEDEDVEEKPKAKKRKAAKPEDNKDEEEDEEEEERPKPRKRRPGTTQKTRKD